MTMADPIVTALNRIEGQVRGIRKMYQEERECEQVIQQISAIQSALKRVGKELLSHEVSLCVDNDPARVKKLSSVVENLLKIG